MRDQYGVMCTEMEQVIIDMLAAQYRADGHKQVLSGLVAGGIGVIPGASFTEGLDTEAVEESILRVAALALWHAAVLDFYSKLFHLVI